MSSPVNEAVMSDNSLQSGQQQQRAEERRRQLNRRAQKAFRERRTEHMTHLETSIEQMNRELQSCQAARTMAVEELLMVKYKNSLLERILFEKGIDINRELNDPRPAKTRRVRNSYDPPLGHISKKKRRRTYAVSSSDKSLSQTPGVVLQTVPTTRSSINSTMSTFHPSEKRSSNVGGHFKASAITPPYPEPESQGFRCEITYGSSRGLPPSAASTSPYRLDQLDPCYSPEVVSSEPDMNNTECRPSSSPESYQSPEIPLATESHTTAKNLAIFEQYDFLGGDSVLGIDPFGLDDILRFPSQF